MPGFMPPVRDIVEAEQDRQRLHLASELLKIAAETSNPEKLSEVADFAIAAAAKIYPELPDEALLVDPRGVEPDRSVTLGAGRAARALGRQEQPALTPADWAGLCALTETSRPEEQEYVLWVIRNRVESPRFPETFEGVVLQPRQFSGFNRFTGRGKEPSLIFDLLVHDLVLSLMPASRILAAVHLAEKVLAGAKSDSLFMPISPGPHAYQRLEQSQAVMHYFSPVSMKPAGSAPAWAKSAKRLFTPPGIDPQRFVFAEGVP